MRVAVQAGPTLDVTQSILGKDDLIARVLNQEQGSDFTQTQRYLFRLDLKTQEQLGSRRSTSVAAAAARSTGSEFAPHLLLFSSRLFTPLLQK